MNCFTNSSLNFFVNQALKVKLTWATVVTYLIQVKEALLMRM